MFLLKRFWPLIGSFFLAVAFSLLVYHPQLVLWVSGLILVNTVFSVLFLIKDISIWEKLKHQEFWRFVGVYGFLVFNGLSFVFFLENIWLVWFSVFIVVFLSGVLLEDIFLFFHRPISYQAYSLENILFYASCLTFFTFWSNMYNFRDWIGLDSITSVAIVLVFIAVVIDSVLWVTKVSKEGAWELFLILELLIAEMAIVLSFWPIGGFIKALIMTLLFATLLGLSREQILERLTRKIILKYLGTDLLISTIALFTARWF